jgi:hypothetical protein
MYSFHVRIPSVAVRRSSKEGPVLKVIRRKRPAVEKVVITEPPLLALPASPALSPTGEAHTPRPSIQIGESSAERPLKEIPYVGPVVDSAIESPGFRPSDDAIVQQKQENRYWRSDYDEEDEYDDGDGFSWCNPLPVYRLAFTESIERAMTQEISANLESIFVSVGTVKLTMIEQFLNYFLRAEHVSAYLEKNTYFSTVLERKIHEFEKDPHATERVKSICHTLRGIYFL